MLHNKNNYLNQFIFLLGGARSRALFLIFLFFSIAFLDVLGIGLVGPYISLVLDTNYEDSSFFNIIKLLNLPTERNNLLITVGLVLISVFLIKAFFSVFIYFQIIKFCKIQEINLRKKLLYNYIFSSFENFSSIKKSDFVDRLGRLCEVFANGILYPLFRVASEGIVAIAIVILLAYQNPIALLILLLLITIAILLYDKVLRSNIDKHGRKANESFSSMIQIFQEIYSGFKEIKIFGKEKFFQDRSQKNSKQYAFSTGLHMLVHIIPKSFLELLMIIFIVTLVVMTTLLNQNSEFLIQTIGIFGVASIRLLPSANIFSSSLVTIRYSRDTIHKIYNDLSEIDKIKKNNTKQTFKNISNFQTITLKNIDFTYKNSENAVLKKINLNINKGEFVGLIGSSGSGKTTLFDIILGFLKPSKGTLKYNEQDIKSFSDFWYKKIAYIPQEIFIINGNIAENISLNDKFNKKKLIDSLKKAKLEEFVSSIEKNNLRNLGDNGSKLSGGQRQRVALARAFYHDREILFLDEATSALDEKIENKIISELSELKGTITSIIISHRNSTLQNCDRILKLDKGNLTEIGNYQDLSKFK